MITQVEDSNAIRVLTSIKDVGPYDISEIHKMVADYPKLLEIIKQLELRVKLKSSYVKFSVMPQEDQDEYLRSIKITQQLKAEIGMKY